MEARSAGRRAMDVGIAARVVGRLFCSRRREAVAAGAFPSPKNNATLFTDIATATGAEAAGAILKYVGLPAPGREKTASGDQIVDPNE